MPQGSASNHAPATGCRLLRAGSSIIDVSGGRFGAMGAIIALYDRERTGKGTYIKGALFETTTFIMGQHLA